MAIPMHNPCTRAIKFKFLMEVSFLFSHAVVLAPLALGVMLLITLIEVYMHMNILNH